MKLIRLSILLFLPSVLHAVCHVSDVIPVIRPGAQFTITGDDLSTLVWLSTQTVPTQGEVDAATDYCNFQRTNAINDLLNQRDSSKTLTRAILLTIFDENNLMRGWIQSFKVAVAASTSLADLKVRVAGLPDMPDRTIQQAKTAVQNKINSGASD